MKPELIELNFLDQPGVLGAYVFDSGDGLALVDCGPSSTLGALEQGLHQLGASLNDLRHLLLTHIHFDHAGAAGTLAQRLPKLRVAVHERGASHLVRPERLIASATQLYGELMDRLWGPILPLDQAQVRVLGQEDAWKLGQTELRSLYTPGHALHHVAYQVGEELYLGDVGGVRLSARQQTRAPTPPPDIQLEQWRQSIQTLRELDVLRLHVAHYGTYPQGTQHWEQLLNNLEADAERVRQALERQESPEAISDNFRETVLAEIEAQDASVLDRYQLACAPEACVLGLIRYWTKKAQRGEPTARLRVEEQL